MQIRAERGDLLCRCHRCVKPGDVIRPRHRLLAPDASLLDAANPGGEAPRMPIRFMVALGVDFWRR
jgi:hypothetical protein